MKKLFLLLGCSFIAAGSFAQAQLGFNAGATKPIKINYDQNKMSTAFSARISYSSENMEGGGILQYNIVRAAAYRSIIDVSTFANLKFKFSQNKIYETGENYMYAGVGMGYGLAYFGKGLSLSFQLGYTLQINKQLAFNVEAAPRGYYFAVNETKIKGEFEGSYTHTTDRFILVPVTFGVRYIFPHDDY